MKHTKHRLILSIALLISFALYGAEQPLTEQPETKQLNAKARRKAKRAAEQAEQVKPKFNFLTPDPDKTEELIAPPASPVEQEFIKETYVSCFQKDVKNGNGIVYTQYTAIPAGTVAYTEKVKLPTARGAQGLELFKEERNRTREIKQRLEDGLLAPGEITISEQQIAALTKAHQKALTTYRKDRTRNNLLNVRKALQDLTNGQKIHYPIIIGGKKFLEDRKSLVTTHENMLKQQKQPSEKSFFASLWN